MTDEKKRDSDVRTRSVSFALIVDPPASKPSSIYLSPNPPTTGPDPAYRTHRRPTLADLPKRTKDNDVPARKTFVWVSIAGIALSLIALALSTTLLVLSAADTVMGGAAWNVVAVYIALSYFEDQIELTHYLRLSSAFHYPFSPCIFGAFPTHPANTPRSFKDSKVSSGVLSSSSCVSWAVCERKKIEMLVKGLKVSSNTTNRHLRVSKH
jgi:hypothetical protein